MEKMYSGTVTSVDTGEVVKGTVVGINNRDVILNIGLSLTVLYHWLNSRK
jgi:small subunit ribosomal protein S1